MRVNHNTSATVTQGALAINNRSLVKNLEKLSTGLRVNRASDDAAGLAISEGLRSSVRGQDQARRNALDGISALNIAEGAMNEMHAILQRQRELATQASNATYTTTERAYMNQEFSALSAELTRIVDVTQFNGLDLLRGDTFRTRNLQVDKNAGGSNLIAMTYNNVDPIGTTQAGQNLNDFAAAQTAITTTDAQIVLISNSRSQIGALVNRLESTVNNLTVSITNQQAAESQIRDVDFARQASKFTTNQILTQSATSMLAQANASTQGVLSLLR